VRNVQMALDSGQFGGAVVSLLKTVHTFFAFQGVHSRVLCN
jgi:hypothetical protein